MAKWQIRLTAGKTTAKVANTTKTSRKCLKANEITKMRHHSKSPIAKRQNAEKSFISSEKPLTATVNTASFTVMCVSAWMGRRSHPIAFANLLQREQRPREIDFAWVAKGLKNRANPSSEAILASEAPPLRFRPVKSGPQASAAPSLRYGRAGERSAGQRPASRPFPRPSLRSGAASRLGSASGGRDRSYRHFRAILGKFAGIPHVRTGKTPKNTRRGGEKGRAKRARSCVSPRAVLGEFARFSSTPSWAPSRVKPRQTSTPRFERKQP